MDSCLFLAALCVDCLFDPLLGPLIQGLLAAIGLALGVMAGAMMLGTIGWGLFAAGDWVIAWLRPRRPVGRRLNVFFEGSYRNREPP